MRHFRARDSAVIALSVMLLAACAAQPTEPADAGIGSDLEESIISLQVHPARAVVQLSDTIAFDAELVVSDDVESMPDLEWTASGGTITAGGTFVAGRRAGKVDVTVKVKGRKKKARAEVIVVEEEPQPTSMHVSPDRATIHPGDTTRFEAAVLDEHGFQMNAAVSWSATVGAIDASGLYTGGSDGGSSQITASGPAGLSATAVVRVLDEERVPSTLEISPGTAIVTSGDTQSFTATVLDQNGVPMSVAPVWSALEGTITSGGVYTAGAVEGTYPVVASASASLADTAWVTIALAPPPDGLLPNGPTGAWSLLFQDEFDGTALDTSKWNLAMPWYNQSINNELQMYDNPREKVGGHVQVQDGTLRLIATDDTITDAGGWHWEYISGAVNSRAKFEMFEGAIEFRAQAAAGKGFISSLWLMPHAWPPEIDIVEIPGSEPTRPHDGVFWGTSDNPLHDTSVTEGHPDLSADFHTYTAEWTSTEVVFYVDGVETHRVTGHSPTVSMYLIMNLSVGGNWAGPPDSSTPWPGTLEVDYVRVWER